MNTMFISPSRHSLGLTGLLERKKIRVSLSVKKVKNRFFDKVKKCRMKISLNFLMWRLKNEDNHLLHRRLSVNIFFLSVYFFFARWVTRMVFPMEAHKRNP